MPKCKITVLKRTINKDLIDEYLSKEVIKRRGHFDYNNVDKLLKQHRSGKKNLGLKIWSLICLEEWQRAYIDDLSYSKLRLN